MPGMGCSGCERERGVAAGAPMALQCEGVHGERVGQQVESLTGGPDGVGSAEPERVVEGAVDGLGVVASGVQGPERRVGGRDGPDVLGAVELADLVFVVAVEANDDDAPAEVVGEAVVVVPAVGADLVGLAAGADPGEFGEELLAGVSDGEDADRAGSAAWFVPTRGPIIWIPLQTTRRTSTSGAFRISWHADGFAAARSAIHVPTTLVEHYKCREAGRRRPARGVPMAQGLQPSPAGPAPVDAFRGLRVMFEDTSPELAALDEVALTLEFEEAGRRTVEAEVIEPGSVVHPEGQR